MILSDTVELRHFREEVRAWLHENVPREPLPPLGPEQRTFLAAWQRRQYDAGWAGIAWPREYGGRGLSVMEQLIWFEEYARAEGPESGCFFIGLNHGGPTLIVNGSEQQRRFHLPRILTGESLWCQGFSEPNAGSDLAALRTTGRIDGDHLVVNGQKIWTSYAQVADYQELLVRTEPGSQRHHGLTWIINDMRLPGLTVRPIEGMTGDAHFCEVFYDDVRIPLANVVGDIGDGWRVAMSTLSFERGTAFMQMQLELSQSIERLLEWARSRRGAGGRPLLADESVAVALASLRSEVAALRAMAYMGVSRGVRQTQPGPEGVFTALFYGELAQRVSQVAMDLLGAEGLDRSAWGEWVDPYLRSFAATIAGGTSEIRRNILGERLLGLPR